MCIGTVSQYSANKDSRRDDKPNISPGVSGETRNCSICNQKIIESVDVCEQCQYKRDTK